MPIYEYTCRGCGSKFELLLPMSRSEDEAVCPTCGKQSKRAISRFSCLAKDETGFTSQVGGSSCGGCNSSSCGSCGTG